MYADTNDTRPGLEEQYLTATNTSDLTLNPDATCAATHLIAAGLLGNRMGAALVHLRSEWDAADKPRKMTEAEIVERAATLAAEATKAKGQRVKPDVRRARTEALVGFATGMRHRAHRLSGWLPALAIMAEWARLRGVDMDLLSPSLYHFLNPVCPVCDGLGRRPLENAPKVGMLGKVCHHCNGQREPGKSEGPTIWPRPEGAQRVHDWLRGCVGKAKADRSGLLRGRIDSEDIGERKAKRPAPPAEDESRAAADAAYFAQSMGKRRN